MTTQLILLNEYTDMKEYELVIKKVDNLVWGFYRDANNRGTISDSQFDVFYRENDIENESLQEELKIHFNAYYLSTENTN